MSERLRSNSEWRHFARVMQFLLQGFESHEREYSVISFCRSRIPESVLGGGGQSSLPRGDLPRVVSGSKLEGF